MLTNIFSFDRQLENKIKSKLGENYSRINANETTNIKCRCVVNVMHIASRKSFDFICAVAGDDCVKVLLFISDTASVATIKNR